MKRQRDAVWLALVVMAISLAALGMPRSAAAHRSPGGALSFAITKGAFSYRVDVTSSGSGARYRADDHGVQQVGTLSEQDFQALLSQLDDSRIWSHPDSDPEVGQPRYSLSLSRQGHTRQAHFSGTPSLAHQALLAKLTDSVIFSSMLEINR